MHLLIWVIRLDGLSIDSGATPTATLFLDLRFLKLLTFWFWLRKSKKLSVSAVLGYRSMLSAVFRTVLPEISTSSVLQDLLRSFKVEVPCRELDHLSGIFVKFLIICDHLFSSP